MMSTANAKPDQDTVISETEIAAPPERVFQALTDHKQLFTWWGSEPSVDLIKFDMDGRKGGKYYYECAPKPGSNMGPVADILKRNNAPTYICHGEVLEFDPPRLLVWSWIANWHENPNHATTVRWELIPTAKGTRVRVTHSGLRDEPISRKDYGQGWVGVLQLLQTFLGSDPKDVIVP
jgi:uncharacterized protein YndB with AHSA1/START domain